MTELINVVLDPPCTTRFVRKRGPDFAGDDFVGNTVTRNERHTVEVHDHSFAHRVKDAVRSAHAYVRRVHEVAKSIGLIGDVPGVLDRRGVASRAEHNIRTLVGTLPRHLREHAVVTDYQGNFAAVRPITHGNAKVARLPRFDRYPRMHFTIVKFLLSVIVYDDSAVVRVAVRVVLHDGETSPDPVLLARVLESLHFWSIKPAHDVGVGVHRQTVQRVLRKHDEIHRRQSLAGLLDHSADLPRLRF